MDETPQPDSRIKVLIIDDGVDKARAALLAQKLARLDKDEMQVVLVGAETAQRLSSENHNLLRGLTSELASGHPFIVGTPSQMGKSISKALSLAALQTLPPAVTAVSGGEFIQINNPYYRQFEKKGRKK